MRTWWMQWVDPVLTFLSWQILSVAAILLCYLGARSIARGERGRKSSSMLLGGVTISVVLGVVSFYLADLNQKVLSPDNPARYKQLPEDWSADALPEEREQGSLAYASMAYRDERKLINYVDRNGTWKPYCPTTEDAKFIAHFAEVSAQLEQTRSSFRSSAISWWVSAVIAVFIGADAGRRKKNDA